jgi:hypothetical protein
MKTYSTDGTAQIVHYASTTTAGANGYVTYYPIGSTSGDANVYVSWRQLEEHWEEMRKKESYEFYKREKEEHERLRYELSSAKKELAKLSEAKKDSEKYFYGVDANLIYSVLPDEFKNIDINFYNDMISGQVVITLGSPTTFGADNNLAKAIISHKEIVQAGDDKREILRILVQAILKLAGLSFKPEKKKPDTKPVPKQGNRRIFVE